VIQFGAKPILKVSRPAGLFGFIMFYAI